jgi:hypothetical protein
MKKLEQEFVTKLQKWLRYNMPMSFAWEAKYPRTKNYYFHSDKSFKKEMTSLLIAGQSFIYKFSDLACVGNPCDGIKLHNCAGYFFFTWNGKDFYVIEVSLLKKYIEDGNKYLDPDNAMIIADAYCSIK